MREIIKEYVKICAETLPILEPIYEFGSLQVLGQVGLADLRPLFPNKKYVGADIIGGIGVDVVLDILNTGLNSESVGILIMVETLEHIEFPRKAIGEIHRILKPNGILIFSSVMDFPYHNGPDYWRFTPDSLASLLKDFTIAVIDFTGEKKYPKTLVAVASKRLLDNEIIKSYKERISSWKIYCRKMERPSLSQLLFPPILYGLERKIKKAWFERKCFRRKPPEFTPD